MFEWVTFFIFLQKVGWAGWLGLSITICSPRLAKILFCLLPLGRSAAFVSFEDEEKLFSD
jgi:hypothetical protein